MRTRRRLAKEPINDEFLERYTPQPEVVARRADVYGGFCADAGAGNRCEYRNFQFGELGAFAATARSGSFGHYRSHIYARSRVIRSEFVLSRTARPSSSAE